MWCLIEQATQKSPISAWPNSLSQQAAVSLVFIVFALIVFEAMTAGKGTFGFQAPEMFSESYGAKVDIFSLGATIYQVANLHRAYTGSREQIMKKLLKRLILVVYH